jgi:hypothetical protein
MPHGIAECFGIARGAGFPASCIDTCAALNLASFKARIRDSFRSTKSAMEIAAFSVEKVGLGSYFFERNHLIITPETSEPIEP